MFLIPSSVDIDSVTQNRKRRSFSSKLHKPSDRQIWLEPMFSLKKFIEGIEKVYKTMDFIQKHDFTSIFFLRDFVELQDSK